MKTARVHVVALVGLLSVMAGGCSQAGSNPTSSTAHTTTTTLQPTITTIDVSTTSSPSTWTTRADSERVTVDPNLPSAMNRAGIPWNEVGAGWYVVLYDSSTANPASEAEAREGPSVLYLVNSDGERFEVASWGPGQYPTLIDATPTSALVARSGANVDETVYEVIDLTSGVISVAHTVEFPETSLIDVWPHASLTRPNGTNVVLHRTDGDYEWLERRSVDGILLSVVYEQPYTEDDANLSWLYGPDGTALVVAHIGGINQVTNEGGNLVELWAPPDTRCEPVRWWDADTFLATCYGQGSDLAPLDEDGEPHPYYGRLWLLEVDGSAGMSLTDYPTDPPIAVDFGYHDAWPTEDDLFLQWSGDCAASAVATLNPDGSGDFLQITTPDNVIADGIRLVDIRAGDMTLYGWEGCDAWTGTLFTSDLDGHYLNTLVPVIGDSRGVTGVIGLRTVYP